MGFRLSGRWRFVSNTGDDLVILFDVPHSADLHVVSTRAGFSDAFAAQYATCLFYKVDGTAVRIRFYFY